MLEKAGESSTSGVDNDEAQSSKKMSLLRRFDIPVHHLDFAYVKKCKVTKEVERILRVLQSGEEGHYPELISFTENRLKKLDPNNRMLRVELPVLKPEYMPKDEREEINQDIGDWITSLKSDEGQSTIFGDDSSGDFADTAIPIRGQNVKGQADQSQGSFLKPKKSTRIKSWEYDKWDKFDVDTELTKIDVTQQQISEWEKYQKPKVQQDLKKVEKLMKNLDSDDEDQKSGESPHFSKCTSTPSSSSSAKINQTLGKPRKGRFTQPGASIIANIDINKPSFIEEISEEKASGKSETLKNQSGPISTPKTNLDQKVAQKSKRRVRVQIEDLNVGF